MYKKVNWMWCLLAASLFFLAMIGNTMAADTLTLDEVVVSAGRFKEPKREVTSNVSIIDEQEIEASTAKDLGGLLAEKNIGSIRVQPGCLTPVSIRGFRTETVGNDLQGKVLILLNGRRAGTGNAAKIMTDNIERIEIIRGPASAQYGSAAMGGVINVITKQGAGKPTGFVQGELGSFGYEEASAGLSGAAGRFDFSGSVSRSRRDDYTTGDGADYENTGFDRKQDMSLNLGYEFIPNNRIGLIYSRFDGEGVGSPNMLKAIDPNTYIDLSNDSVDCIYDGSTPQGLFSWKARYFTGTDEYDYIDPTYPSSRDTDQKGAQAQMTWNPGQYRLTAGWDWVNYDIETNYDPKHTEYDNPSYFLLGKAKFFQDRLIFSGGARYDSFEVQVKGGQGGTENDEAVSPRLGVAYFLRDNLKLRVNYGQAFKMPAAEELAGDYVLFGAHYVGNPKLHPEKSETYEAGLDWYQGAFDASLTYFMTDYTDKIDLSLRNDGIWTWENLGQARISGFEGDFSYDLGALWGWDWEVKPYLRLTYLTELEDKDTGKDLLYTSKMNFSYGLSVADTKGFSAKLNFAYTGEQDINYYDPVTYTATRMDKGGFTVANLSVQQRILDLKDKGSFSIRGEVRNIFDREYAYVKGYPMPGRNFVLGVKYTY